MSPLTMSDNYLKLSYIVTYSRHLLSKLKVHQFQTNQS